MTRPPEAGQKSLGDVAALAVESFSDLVQVHIALAKAELARDMSRLAHDLLPLAVALPLLVTAYLLISLAIAATLNPWMSPQAALGTMGFTNLAFGLASVGVSRWRFARPRPGTENAGLGPGTPDRPVRPPFPPNAP